MDLDGTDRRADADYTRGYLARRHLWHPQGVDGSRRCVCRHFTARALRTQPADAAVIPGPGRARLGFLHSSDVELRAEEHSPQGMGLWHCHLRAQPGGVAE